MGSKDSKAVLQTLLIDRPAHRSKGYHHTPRCQGGSILLPHDVRNVTTATTAPHLHMSSKLSLALSDYSVPRKMRGVRRAEYGAVRRELINLVGKRPENRISKSRSRRHRLLRRPAGRVNMTNGFLFHIRFKLLDGAACIKELLALIYPKANPLLLSMWFYVIGRINWSSRNFPARRSGERSRGNLPTPATKIL